MYIEWNDDSFRWFCEASAYTGFNEKLAEILLKQMETRGTLADLGCGLGLVDMELSPYLDHITCVDIDESAIGYVSDLAAKRGIKNITAVCADASKLSGQWDTVMALFHGRLETFISDYLALAKETFIAVIRGTPVRSELIPAETLHKYRTVEQTSRILDSIGINYELITGSLEYGQPFRSRKDAQLYAEAYKKMREGETIERCLDRILVSTEDPEFPFYMPYEKKYGMYIIKKADNIGIEFSQK